MRYTIKKGKHYSVFTIDRLLPFTKLPILATVKFHTNCWYELNEVQYTGYNKLIGASSLNIHNKSGRIVWQPDWHEHGVIRLYGYVYPGSSKWKAKYIASVRIDEEFDVQINNTNDEWEFIVFKHHKSITSVHTIKMLGIKPKGIFKYMIKTYPYFGGKSVAPKTINIDII
jgi:hypothetical protein